MNHDENAKGLVVWFTGLPASGKSTWAKRLQKELKGKGRPACLLDGDDIRKSVHPSLGYDELDRDEHYLVLARLAAYIAKQDLLVLVAATAHKKSYRTQARELAPRFAEVFVDLPLHLCQQRDPKSLYRTADATSSALPGRGVLYEAPEFAEFTINGNAPKDSDNLSRLLQFLLDETSP